MSINNDDSTEEFDVQRGKGITITFDNVCYSVQLEVGGLPWKKQYREKEILHNISGSVGSGKLLAIMGPTGSGKTSLLHVLSGKRKTGVTGDITIEGCPSKQLKRKTAFVMQQDIFFSDSTVKETLDLTALLRLPASLTKREKLKKVNDMIEELGLSGAAHTQIGGSMAVPRGISGGEKKRLNIGNELLTNPDLIMVDEPTAGLDSSTAWIVLSLLKALCDKGKTVIATIHQPSSKMYTLFDDLMLLSEGHVVYYGPASKATAYFSQIAPACPLNYNPADYLLELVVSAKCEDGETPLKTQLIEHYESVVHPELVLPASKETEAEGKKEPKWPSSFFDQFFLLAARSFRQKRGVVSQPLYIAQVIAAIIIISVIWFQHDDSGDDQAVRDTTGLLFFCTVYWTLLPMLKVIATFPAERAVLSRERATGTYRISAFYLSKQFVEIPLDLMMPVIFCVVIYWATGLEADAGKFFIFTAAILLDVSISYAIGLWISSAILNAARGAVLATTYFVFTMLLGGFYINNDSMPDWLAWAKYLSPVRYIFNILIINEFKGKSYEEGGDVIEDDDIFDDADVDPDFFPYNFLVLIFILSLATFLGYLSLRFLNRPKL